jgi:hypothetical protein
MPTIPRSLVQRFQSSALKFKRPAPSPNPLPRGERALYSALLLLLPSWERALKRGAPAAKQAARKRAAGGRGEGAATRSIGAETGNRCTRPALLVRAAALLLAGLLSWLPARADDGTAALCDGSTLPNGPYSGADGPYRMRMVPVPDPGYPGQDLLLFQPVGAGGRRPVIFFAHGFGPNRWQTYVDLISHLVSLGYVLVYAPYPTDGTDNIGRYTSLWAGFVAGAQAAGADIDLTRVGFLGHSFGGGAVPFLAYQGLVGQGWGRNGAFMMLLTPWYSEETGDALLQGLPARLIRAEQIYDADVTNDHRMAIDIDQHLASAGAKYFFLGKSGDLDGCTLTADHSVPGSNPSLLLKRLALFRPLDAIASLAFDHSSAAAAALAQMGDTVIDGYQPIAAETAPVPDAPQSNYQWPWDSPSNPRQAEEPSW